MEAVIREADETIFRLEDIEMLIYNFGENYPKFKSLEKHVSELIGYLRRNRQMIKNYGERWRAGQVISTAFVESLVNSLLGKRFTKKQQMQWTKRGAHLLLQVRTKTLNQELVTTFQRWYRALQVGEERKIAALSPLFLMLSRDGHQRKKSTFAQPRSATFACRVGPGDVTS
jgi:hypothetical protein